MTNKRSKKKQNKRTKTAGRKAAIKKRRAQRKAHRTKTAPRVKKPARKNRVRGKSISVETIPFEAEGLGARSGGQAGDLQGMSDAAGADSESVEELLEEGNAFEAEAVKGVQDAEDADEGEVRTHEEPENDVPGEYRDSEK